MQIGWTQSIKNGPELTWLKIPFFKVGTYPASDGLRVVDLSACLEISAPLAQPAILGDIFFNLNLVAALMLLGAEGALTYYYLILILTNQLQAYIAGNLILHIVLLIDYFRVSLLYLIYGELLALQAIYNPAWL